MILSKAKCLGDLFANQGTVGAFRGGWEAAGEQNKENNDKATQHNYQQQNNLKKKKANTKQ